MPELLSEYHKKRDFNITGEPKGKTSRGKKSSLSFVIQKHGARRLHYDFRLELDGVMKSWAVTKGPSYDPADKRLAVRTEDHPIEYNQFEGVIPDKQYGAGPVMIWDNGIWIPDGDPHKGLKKGNLTFNLIGTRMHGRWHLVRMQTKEKRENWLLIKGSDEYVLPAEENKNFLEKENTSLISKRTLDEIKENLPVKHKTSALTSQKKPNAKTVKALEKLQQKYASPELATLVEFPPPGADWIHEIKYDGYRIMAFIHEGHVILRTRGGKDWTHKFLPVAHQLSSLGIKSAVLDGELCVLDEKGTTNFSALQAALTNEEAERIEAWLFDLLFLNGEDYSKAPLHQRKTKLESIIKNKNLSHIHYSEHFESNPDLLQRACEIGAEGLVSKNKNSIYRFRRTHDWLKSKCGQEQEFVIGGFMPAKDNSKAVGSLLLGYYKGDKLLYAGKVGTGFGQNMARLLYERLNPLRVESSPFEGPVERSRRKHFWTKPEVLCEVSFWEWTPDAHIRHASFKGLREDKEPKAVKKEVAEKPKLSSKRKEKKSFTVEGVEISHPDREVYPGLGITKGDIALYYSQAAPYMMPFIENRLISLVRCTNSIEKECFFQRNPMKGMGANIMGRTITHKGNKHNYIYVDSAQGLLQLVQMGSIEFHAWQSKVDNIGKPDQIIFDLDPAEGIPFEAIKLAAKDVRKRLSKTGLESFPRLSGGKGIHIVVPIVPEYGWNEIKAFAQDFARQMEKAAPSAYISTMTKKKRTGKIFIDYFRNDFSATAISPFSLRVRPGAAIAVPLSWSELDKIDVPAAYNFSNISRKMNKRTEKLIQDFLSLKQKLKI